MSRDNSVSLPRGLVAKRGTTLVSTTQRLPSLKCESNSNQIATSTTKGGAVKRVFKPTIPSRRQAAENSDIDKAGGDQVTNSKKPVPGKLRGVQNNRNDKKNSVIQLEAAVFSGDSQVVKDAKPRRSGAGVSTRNSSAEPNKVKDSKQVRTKSTKVKTEVKTEDEKIIDELLGDNFIDDSGSDEELLLPKGWEAIGDRNRKRDNSSQSTSLTPFNLLTTENDDKFLVMQVPELISQKPDGYFGKIRVFKSGKIEIEDEETGIKFDVVVEQDVNGKVKSEDKKQQPNRGVREKVCQEVVTLDGNRLTSLGFLSHSQVLTVIPQISLDD